MSLNLNVLKSIGMETYVTNESQVSKFFKRKTLTEDMMDIVDYVNYLSFELIAHNPTFSNRYQTYFSFEGRLFSIVTVRGVTSLRYEGNLDIEYDDINTYSDFLEDYDVYYYLNLDNMTVCSLWNNKPCIIKENV